MNSIIKNEGISNPYWIGTIHYDTDNIHIHTSLIQTIPVRKKGKFRQRSLKIAKSEAIHSLDRSNQKNMITLNDLLRNRMLEKRIGRVIQTAPELMSQYENIFNRLPDDKRLWKYNMNALHYLRPEINEFIDNYLKKHKPSELEEFNRLINKMEVRSKYLYGNTISSYSENKRRELYSRMGNALLKDILERSKEGTLLGVPEKMIKQIQTEKEQVSQHYTEKRATGRTTISQYRRLQ